MNSVVSRSGVHAIYVAVSVSFCSWAKTKCFKAHCRCCIAAILPQFLVTVSVLL